MKQIINRLSTIMTTKSTAVHWFRLDLRVHDNLALRNAINEAENRNYYMRPVYFMDPNISDKFSPNKLRFLIQSLQDLSSHLKKLNTHLHIIIGNAVDMLPKLFDEWNVKFLSLQVDIDAELVKQDEVIEKIAEEKDIFIVKRVQHTVYDVHSILRKNNGMVPLTYPKFLSLIQDLNVRDAVYITKKIMDDCKPSEEELNKYDIQKFDQLGLTVNIVDGGKYPGGEKEALRRLDEYMAKVQWVCKFEKPNTSPNSLEPSTTVLSPYLSHGCLSPKLFYHKLKAIQNNSPHTRPPTSLMGQLLWREFYYTAAAGTENFDKMIGNKICTQIPWGKNEEHLKAWAEGKTGYPFVDAIMIQLKQEGWIHHLARHMVACFLTRGDLWISWEKGAKVFEYYLLDYDWALNAGNWMWLSASAFFYKYFRVYSPVAFGKKTDKDGQYIRKYLPSLKKYPSQYIYEPWHAPKTVQQAAGCIVGEDYPNRIVLHEIIHKENMTKMSLAYKQNKEKKVLKRKR